MNREIKFRAWDEGNKVMHLNFQFFTSGDGGNDWICFSSNKEPRDTQTVKHGILFDNPYFRQQLKIMQFTGLIDKNGKEIYEGDICRFDAVEIDGFDCLICDLEGEVRWDSEDTGFYYLTSSDRFPHVKPWFTINMAVIGNIYENPELLTESGI